MWRGISNQWGTVAVCVCAAVATASATQVIYVDDDAVGSGGGSSWTDACKYLQDALTLADAATKPVEIHIAGGIYRPDQGAGTTPGDRAATFQLLDGVALRGGYAGLAVPDGGDRDLTRYETVLSGDLLGNDVEVIDPCQFLAETLPTWTDNSMYVVTASGTDSTAELDGLTITAGYAVMTSGMRGLQPLNGSGLLNEAGSPTIRRCIFRANFSHSGGAVCNHNGDPTFSQCTFDRNAASDTGGAVWNGTGSPTFSQCTFDRNAASPSGGAMYNYNAEIVLTDCTFSGNVANKNGMGQGGAIRNDWYTHAVLKGCIFTDNESWDGGAIHSIVPGTLVLEDCHFERNRAMVGDHGSGGAICSWGDRLTMTGCTFDQNSAAREGGAVRTDDEFVVVECCTFTGNATGAESSSFTGGAFRCGGTIVTVSDTRFEGNVSSWGGAIHTTAKYMDITRCSFADNVAWGEQGSLFAGTGGAICSHYTWMHSTDCTFDRNHALTEGGAIWSQAFGRVFLDRCEFAGNDAEKGGAIWADNLGIPVTNCLFSGNRAQQGGAIFGSFPMLGSRDLTVAVRNSTFAGNGAEDGPTFACDAPSYAAEFSHCILWDGGTPFWSQNALEVAVVYSDILGGYEGEGNIDIDPCFVSPGRWIDPARPDAPTTADDVNAVWAAGDYHLQSQGGHWDRQSETWVRDDQTSLCIDTGSFFAPFNEEPFPNGGIVNLGAYGGTAEASKSYFGEPVCDTAVAGDINGDCIVDAADEELMKRNSMTPAANQPPTIAISQPLDGAVIEVDSSHAIIPIIAEAADADGTVEEVRFLVESRTENGLLRTALTDYDGADGWQWSWNWLDSQHTYPEGQYTIRAYAIDDRGDLAFSPTIMVTICKAK